MSVVVNADLGGRVAIVTGAARNIGRAIAVELGSQGARVVVAVQSSVAEAQKTAELVAHAGGQAMVHLADVSTPEGAQSLAEATAAKFGGIDILVNNAAIRRESPFDKLDWQQWRAVMGVVLDGAYLCTHAATPWLRTSTAGAIVNIGGMSAHSGSKHRVHVIAAKSGLVGFTKALAHDLAADKVTVNYLSPGLINTARNAGAPEPQHHQVHATLTGERGRPEEIASVVRFLCGPGARYITGQTIHANGGAYLP